MPFPQRVPPSKQNFPSLVPNLRRSSIFQAMRIFGGTCAMRQNLMPWIISLIGSLGSRALDGALTTFTGNWCSGVNWNYKQLIRRKKLHKCSYSKFFCPHRSTTLYIKWKHCNIFNKELVINEIKQFILNFPGIYQQSCSKTKK